MEIITPPTKNSIQFSGRGVELFGIMLLNWLLIMVTLGLYYPWARVNKVRFFWENTSLNESPFVFHGTGKQLFKGFIKVFILFILLYGSILYAAFTHNPVLAVSIYIIFMVLFILIIPLAIHGALRYRLSQTSWRGIHMGYRGDRGQLVGDFIIGYILTVLTVGIYSPWFINRLRTYIIGNIRFGNLYFHYNGNGLDLFIINLKGMVLTFLTLGIYYFWYMKEWMNYFADHTYIEQNGQKYRLSGNYSGGRYFGLVITNLLLVVCTLGIGTAWAIVRNMNFIIENLTIPEQIDFNNIKQTEDEYTDATGDDMLDILDLGII